MKTRIDRLTAITIDAILNNHGADGVQQLARALAERDVPLDVALRIVTRPWQKRDGAHAPLPHGLSRPSRPAMGWPKE